MLLGKEANRWPGRHAPARESTERFFLCALDIVGRSHVDDLMSRVLAILFLCSLLCPARTFTNTTGKKLEAEVVSVGEHTATLRRTSDQKEFTVQLDTLSAKDRAFLESWNNHPLGWKRLRIHAEGMTVLASCSPIYGQPEGLNRSRLFEGNYPIELHLPVGASVRLGIHPAPSRVEALVRYDGAAEWRLSEKDGVLFVASNKSTKPRPVGVSYRNNNRLPFTDAQEALLKKGASLHTGNKPDGDLLLPKSSFSSLTLSLDKNANVHWQKLPHSLRAIEIQSKSTIDLAGIARLSQLEHLAIHADSVSGLSHLPKLRKLRSLSLGRKFPKKENVHLGKLPLRHLSLINWNTTSEEYAQFDFLLNLPHLEALDLAADFVRPAQVRHCKRLTRINFSMVPCRKENWEPFPLLTDVNLPVFPSTSLALMRTAHYRRVHTLRGCSLKQPLVQLPNLRTMELMTGPLPKNPPPWEPLPSLERLELTAKNLATHNAVCNSPIFQKIRHLDLIPFGKYDPNGLSSLPNLTSLAVGGIQWDGDLDLGKFPKLKLLRIRSTALRSVSGLERLRTLHLEQFPHPRIPSYTKIGKGAPTQLEHLEVLGTKLQSLEGIKNSPRLRSLFLYNCKELVSHAGLADLKTLRYLRVLSSPNLESSP